MPDAVIIVNQKGIMVEVNARAEELFGYSREEMLGQTVEMLVPEQFRSIHAKERVAYSASPRVRPMGGGLQLRGLRKDGSVFPADIALAPLKTHEEMFTIATIRDMTEQYHSQRFTENVLATVPSGLVAIGDKSQVLSVNRSFCTLFGVRREQVEGKLVDDVLRIVGFSEECRAVVARRQPFRNVECTCTIPGKGVATFQLTLSRIRFAEEEEEEEEALLVIDDITERKRAEEELRKSEDRYRTLFQSVGEAILISDAGGRYVEVNQEACNLTGYSRDELLNLTVGDLVEGDRADLLNGYRIFHQQMRTRRVFRAADRRMRRKDGTVFEYEVNAVYIENDLVMALIRDITERKRAEEEIRRSRQQYEELVNSVDGIVWEADARTFQFSFVSQQAERILGYPAERWITEPTFWKDHIHPEDREWVLLFCIKATAEKRPHQFEYRMIAADGRVVWVRDNVVVVLKDGEPQVLRGIMVEITERKRAEQEREVLYAIGETVNTTASLHELLQSIHRNIKKLMDAENCYIALYDADTDLISFPLFVDQFDPTPEPRTKRKGLTEYVLRTGKPLLLTPELFDELVRDGEVEIIGTPPKSWLGVPLVVESQPVGVLVVQSYEPGRRYTEREKDMLVAIGNQAAIAINRKRTEETLQRTLSLLTATLESTADGLLVVNTEGKIVSFNQKFLDLWRIPDSIIASRDDDRALGFVLDQLKDPEGFLKKVRELYAQPEADSYDTLEFKDGRVFERYSHPQRLGGKTVGRVWSFRDITEQRKLEEQFRQAQKMESIGTLAGGIAHDFNNILGIILGHASVLEQAAQHPEKLRRSIEAISKTVMRGAELVKGLLMFARKTSVHMESVNVNDVVEELLHMVKETFPKVITFSLQLERTLPSIHADRGQLYQAMLNLCVNARDAMPSGGTLAIRTAAVEGKKLRDQFPGAAAERYVAISVADTGAGMDQATLHRIFEPFFTTKEVGKGTGLGLSVVYGIVQTHQGFIDVESEVGRGTTFHLYFPLREYSIEPEREKRTEEQDAPGGTETILVIEDEELLLGLVQSILESKGYKVITAHDGVAAVKQYAQHKEDIAVVLTDIGLPKLDGREVFLHLQALNPNVKVILASGYLEPDTKSAMFKAGVKEFVQKPYRPSEVLKKIREVLDKK